MPSLGDIRFIDNNPATEGYTQRAGALTSQRAAEVQADRLQADLDQQQRQRAIDQGIDSAMADVVRARTSATAPAPSSPGATVAPLPAAPAQAMPQIPREGTAVPDTLPLAPAPQPQPVAAAPQAAPQPSLAMQAAGRLANVRGGGKQAFTLMQAQQQQQDQWEELAIKALGMDPPDMQTFAYYQQKSGLQIPQEVISSKESAMNFGRAMAIAKQNYAGDQQQAMVFAQTFMATPGQWDEKLAAASHKAGPPRDKPNWTATTVYQNGQGILAFYDSNSRGQPQVQQTGLVNHKPAEPYFSPQPIVREDGSTGLGAFDIRSGKVTDTGQKMGARPTGGMAKNMLVKMGQNSGTLYDATHEGPGQDGEAVITLPADQASRLAVAKGNQMSRERIATITGDYGLAKTELGNEGKATVANINGGYGIARQETANQGRADVANINGQWGAAKVDQQGANSLATQKLRNEGALAVAEKRGQAGAAGRSSAWVQQFNQRKAANQGMSDAEIIAQMDTQKQPHERALWAKAVVAADKESDMAGRKINDTPEKLQAAAERTFAVMKKGGAQPAAQPAQPLTVQPAGPASARPDAEQVVTQPAQGHNAAKTQKGPDGKDYPVASSEAEYAALPPGSVYFNAVKGKFLTKGK